MMILIEATPREYVEKGSFEIPNVQTYSWSHPVVTGGRLYLREQDALNVYDVRATSEVTDRRRRSAGDAAAPSQR